METGQPSVEDPSTSNRHAFHCQDCCAALKLRDRGTGNMHSLVCRNTHETDLQAVIDACTGVNAITAAKQPDSLDDLPKEDSLDDLLKETEHLAKHMASYQHDIPPDITSSTEISEESKSNLLQQIEDLVEQTNRLKFDLMVLEPETLPDTNMEMYLLMLKVRALTAEYEQWEDMSPDIISNNQDVLLAAGKEELTIADQDLEKMLSVVCAENKNLKKDLEKQKRWLEEQQRVVDMLDAKIEELNQQQASVTQERVFQKLRNKIQKVRSYRDELVAAFGDFLEVHFPVPEKEDQCVKKKKGDAEEPPVKWLLLQDILETLINQLIDSPHDPYIVIKDEYWPPYIEMLLRYGMALRHPTDTNRMRLEAFHQ